MNKGISLKIFHILLIISISILFGYYFGINSVRLEWKIFSPILSVKSKSPPSGSSLDMKLFYDVLSRVGQDYYDKSKFDSKKILYGAISGMLQSLDDPYTSFFPPKENSSFKTQLSGAFEGIGAELGVSANNRIIVISPLDNSPAEKAGIRSGDSILKVDGKDTTGWNLPQAVEKIRGPKGSSVLLTIFHEGAKTAKEYSIVRDTIIVKSVTGWVKDVVCSNGKCGAKEQDECKSGNSGCQKIAYIRLSQFGDRTNEEWAQVVNTISSQVLNKNLKGIILDIRNNPGGYLTDAVFIASEFLKDGVIVKQEDNEGVQKSLSVTRVGVLTEYPLIVLINKGSASASEIVAGALSDHKRALLLGDKSFGKGTIQEAVDVDSGASVHITVAKWLTPNGAWVNQKGLTPNIEVKLDSKDSSRSGEFDNQLDRAINELVSK